MKEEAGLCCSKILLMEDDLELSFLLQTLLASAQSYGRGWKDVWFSLAGKGCLCSWGNGRAEPREVSGLATGS